MKTHHWISFIVVALIFYIIGAKMPALADKLPI
jgi:hypothetical protein